MAKMKQGILGGISGKVANVVGTSWKGIAVLKSLPLSVANPKTTAQVAQRTAFASVVALGSKVLTSICIPLWNALAQQMSGFNMFVQKNVSLFDASGICAFADLHLSIGPVGDTEVTVCTYTDSVDEVAVEWDDTTLPVNGLATDLVMLVVGDKYGKIAGVLDFDTVVRSDGEIEMIVVIEGIDTDSLAAQIIFKSADGIRQSNSTGLICAHAH
jgi:hypothetical protein